MHLITLGVYVICLAAAVALTLWSRRHPDEVTPPGALLDALFASRAARIAIILFWWWIGWHFLFAQTLDG